MTLAQSAHGTLVYYQPTPGGSFTEIAELGDITMPQLQRNEFDATVQNRDMDSYVLGVLRRGAFTFPLHFLPKNGTHDHLTGLYKLLIENTYTGFKCVFPDADGAADTTTQWIMSGQVQTISPKAPVDGKLAADVTLRFSGLMSIGGVAIGNL